MARERSVEAPGGAIRYLEAGSGWPLVLLHAFPLSADMWQPQLEAPPGGWRLIAPDLRGLGPARRPPAATMDDMAADVVVLLDALRLERAMIAGVSMGGYVALALFRTAPERCSGIVLVNSRAGADSPEARAGRDRMIALVRERGAAAVADEMLPRLLGRTSRASRPDVEPLVRRLIEANAPEGIAGALEAMKNRPDSTPMLPSVGRPALVVRGAEDEIIAAEEAERLDRQLPRSQLVTLPDAGHLCSLEAPADFNEALGNFLRANI